MFTVNICIFFSLDKLACVCGGGGGAELKRKGIVGYWYEEIISSLLAFYI